MSKFHALARYPFVKPGLSLEFAVVWHEASRVAWAAEHLARALADLFQSEGNYHQSVRKLRHMSPSAVNLVLLDDQSDLNEQLELRDALREAEAAGIRFKLARLGSLGKRFPARNIAYDLFVIGGGKPWIPADDEPAFCAMDAGHDKEGKRSRWVKVEADQRQAITKVSVFDTHLAEHIPAGLVTDMWPSDPTAVVCRDGRLSQEKGSMEARAQAEDRALIEVKKSPKAILWRTAASTVRAAEFGDAVVDEHDELLLQTVPQNTKDYVHPVRLAVQGGDAMEMAVAFLHQQAMPGLSLFHMARLPGALYFADLVSKLTRDGWPKVVGRGFNIPQVVP